MDDYLTKPLRLRTLQTLVGRIPGLAPGGATPATPPESGFDPAPLREIGDPETEAALAVMFLDQAAERMPALLEAIQGQDAERLHQLAHGLKGSAATVGAVRMSDLSRDLCELAQGGVTATAAEIHSELAEALSATSTALSGYIDGITAA